MFVRRLFGNDPLAPLFDGEDTSAAPAAGGSASGGGTASGGGDTAPAPASVGSWDDAFRAGEDDDADDDDAEDTDTDAAESAETAPADADFLADPKLREWLDAELKPLLDEHGGVEGLRALQTQREQEAAQQQERDRQADTARQDRADIQQRLTAQVQNGELDPDAYDQALRYEVANARLYRIEMNDAVSQARSKFPDMDAELVQHFAQDPQTVQAIAAHTHSRVAALKQQHAAELKTAGERAVAQFVASQAENRKSPPPEGGGGSPPGAPATKPQNLGSWGSLLNMGKRKN